MKKKRIEDKIKTMDEIDVNNDNKEINDLRKVNKNTTKKNEKNKKGEGNCNANCNII